MPRRCRRLTGSTLAVAASLGVTLLASAPVTAQAVPPAASAPAALGQHLVQAAHPVGAASSVTDYTSNNWDGYFATAPSHHRDFTAVSATWTQAAVKCTSTKAASAGFWVGLDGWWNDEVEQGGSEARCLNGVPHYNVWWEMFPFNSIQDSFAIHAGDTIHASVTYHHTSKMFDIVVQDRTSGQTLTKDTRCQPGQHGCPRSSAEIISEDIGHTGGGLFPLPDYGTEAYTTASVTNTHGHTGTLSSSAWQLGHVTEVTDGVTKQTTSALAQNGTSFTTTWKHQ